MTECSACRHPAADALRAARADWIDVGVRPRGPLAWTPPANTGEGDDAVTRGRRRVLAHRRVRAVERRRRVLEQIAVYWREAA